MFSSSISVSDSNGKIIPFRPSEYQKSLFDYNNYIEGIGIKTNICIKRNDDLVRNLNILSDIELLEDGWDGYGGSAISSGVIEKSKKILKELVLQPVIFPTGRNSIQIQYETEDNSYLEFEIFADKILCLEVPQRIYEKAKFDTYYFNNRTVEQINKRIEGFHAGKHISKGNTLSSSQAFQAKLA